MPKETKKAVENWVVVSGSTFQISGVTPTHETKARMCLTPQLLELSRDYVVNLQIIGRKYACPDERIPSLRCIYSLTASRERKEMIIPNSK